MSLLYFIGVAPRSLTSRSNVALVHVRRPIGIIEIFRRATQARAPGVGALAGRRAIRRQF
jgi:hypothetical protein